ncbi:hypothetical protein MHUMG1_01652 [Metarhizium humberi]|uniref:Uncharacterized protein n=1 Tax=Metarhizium humberi TaxID=2596975 RepID=A0A9P8MJX5_9HYPO|nr:hypothetical protein MHUMG1_01652 [Metarhizium humberi]
MVDTATLANFGQPSPSQGGTVLVQHSSLDTERARFIGQRCIQKLLHVCLECSTSNKRETLKSGYTNDEATARQHDTTGQVASQGEGQGIGSPERQSAQSTRRLQTQLVPQCDLFTQCVAQTRLCGSYRRLFW